MVPTDRNGIGPGPLEKLGIQAIQQRLEVSPIIADPGGFTPGDGDGGDGKTYVCNVFPPQNPKLEPTEVPTDVW